MRRLVAACLFSFAISGAFAQNEPVKSASPGDASTATSTAFSLREAVTYALQNNVNVTNAQLDIESAKARVGEIRAVGLPQISADAQLMRNINIQTQFVPANAFVKVDENGNPIPDDIVQPLAFGVPYQGIATISVKQLIFSGSYLIGLKAAKTYKELSQKSLTQSKINIVESVTKAYYSVLVNQQRLELLTANLQRLDSLFFETKAMYQNGMVEKIDADRVEVQLNNLKVEKDKTNRLVDLSYYLLKYQMGLPVNDTLHLTDELNNAGIETIEIPTYKGFDFSQRVEYSTLQTQQQLANLDIKNNQAGYLPTLAAFGNFGYNNGRVKFDILSSRWYGFSVVGLSLSVPIFDGLDKRYKIQQARITSEKAKQGLKLLESGISLEIQQASVNLVNSLESLKIQRRNLELAQEVARVTRIKYQQGVGANIEVINAETSYKEAQTNYYSALYDALISKVDADKATGKLAAE